MTKPELRLHRFWIFFQKVILSPIEGVIYLFYGTTPNWLLDLIEYTDDKAFGILTEEQYSLELNNEPVSLDELKEKIPSAFLKINK
jgi:hypothetical protein